jgi:hypothetical protein
MRFLDEFAFMARSLKWFQIRFPRRMASLFMLQARKTLESACCGFLPRFFKVSEGGSRTQPDTDRQNGLPTPGAGDNQDFDSNDRNYSSKQAGGDLTLLSGSA